jgi:hypothetical protein
LGRWTPALTFLRYRLAQRHIPRSGAMIVLPNLVNEYSKALALVAARRVINPVDSRLRRVLVSMRWETFPTLRRKSPCRYGLWFSEKRPGLSWLLLSAFDITWCLVLTR